MSIQSYYRWALLLPLAVPALASSLLLLGQRLPPDLGGIVFFLYWSLLIGGVPYVLFAVGFLLWARGRSDREVRTAILLSPLVYTAVLMTCFAGLLALDGALDNSPSGIGMIGGFGVLFGYAYVILAEIGRVVLRPGRTASPLLPAA